MSKNRRLLDDLTKLRVAHEELNTQFERTEEMSEGFRTELDRVKGLNERLEADLARLNGSGDGPVGSGEKGLAGLDIGRPVGASPALSRC